MNVIDVKAVFTSTTRSFNEPRFVIKKIFQLRNEGETATLKEKEKARERRISRNRRPRGLRCFTAVLIKLVL